MKGRLGTKTTLIAVTMCISFSTSTKWFSTCMVGGMLHTRHLLWSTVMLSVIFSGNPLIARTPTSGTRRRNRHQYRWEIWM